MRRTIVLAVLAMALAGLVGCGEKEPTVGQTVDSAVKDAQKAGDDASKSAEKAADDAKKALEK